MKMGFIYIGLRKNTFYYLSNRKCIIAQPNVNHIFITQIFILYWRGSKMYYCATQCKSHFHNSNINFCIGEVVKCIIAQPNVNPSKMSYCATQCKSL